MEAILAIAIGVVASTGVWLLLRGRTFQVVIGLSLLSYAVNLFIFATGRLTVDREPVLLGPLRATLQHYDDPLPQALVLTAIVIGFAMTALLLVVTMALRGLSGNDHVDGLQAPPGPRDALPATGASTADHPPTQPGATP
jgi:multicomponent K+:H+ antiporter subunit C